MKKYFLCTLMPFFTLLVLFLGLLTFFAVGAGNSVWYGWGVDTHGRGYVGKATEILVYQNGEHVNSIDVPKCRTYYFTVNEDDNIILSTSLTVYVMDLEGELISSKADEGCSVYNKLQWLPDNVKKNGEIFRLRKTWGRRVIEADGGEIIYSSSVSDVVVFMVATVVILALFLLGAVVFIRKIMQR